MVSHKKNNEILSFVMMWTDLQGFMLKEISQKERKTLPFTYMWNPKNKQTNKQKEQTQQNRDIDTEKTKTTGGCQSGKMSRNE